MRRSYLNTAVEVVTPVLAVALWWILSDSSDSLFFPPLRRILENFADQWLFDQLGTDLLPSLGRLLAGLTIAVVAGIAFGVLLGQHRGLQRATSPVVEFLRALPSPILIPFGLLTLGTGTTMKVFVIALGSLWPVLLNTMDGVRGVDPTLLATSKVYGLRRSVHVRFVLLPAAGPQIMAGIRTALSVSVILMVISEMVVSTNGVGFRVLQAQRSFAIGEMWAGIVMLGILGYALSNLFLLVERRVLRWHRGMTSGIGSATSSSRPRRRTRTAPLTQIPEAL